MKTTITFLLAFLSLTLFSQAPQKISYQAVVRDNNGLLIVDKHIALKVSILKESISGQVVYFENISPTTNSNGLVSFEIGNAFGFDQIDWSQGPFFVKTDIDLEGGSNYTLSGTQELLSVPFALYAGNVNNSDTSATNEIQTLSISGNTLSISGGNSIELPSAGSSGSGNSVSLEYPDGREGTETIVKNIFTESYTVPAGKNFYIQSAQRGLTVDTDTFDVSYPPHLIIGEGREIKGLETESVMLGFEVDATVSPFILTLEGTSYVVPTGKQLVLVGVSFIGSSSDFMINGIKPNPNGWGGWREDLPMVFKSGDEIQGDILINGYLR